MTKEIPLSRGLVTIVDFDQGEIQEVFIYGLHCPITNQLRYVGKSGNPNYRLARHLCEPPANTRKHRWLAELREAGETPVLSFIEKTDSTRWPERERYWIKKLRSEGHDLTNETEGGDGREKGFRHKPEAIMKIVAALNARSPESRKRAAEKNSQVQRGRSFKKEHREKIRDAHKRRWASLSQEEKENITAPLNHGWSNETRKKLSETRTGRKMSKFSTSQYLGVSWFKRDEKWRAWLKYNGKQIHLGYFACEKEAALAYNRKAIELFGENAKLNILDNGQIQ